jgi:hypothetical protein
MARHGFAGGEDGFRIWMVVANILNSSRGQPTRGGTSVLGLGGGLTAPYRKKAYHEMLHRASGTAAFLEMGG